MPPKQYGEETRRLEEDRNRVKNWKRWGPYLSDRQWATVREDYSANGDSWESFPHDHARSRAYRWGEDGLLGFTDRQCRLCFGLALWNEKDPILKERLFGLTGREGNHGEDVKECYYYLDATPTYTYARALYKYPHAQYPYEWLVRENDARGLHQAEFELYDTGIFENDEYFDVFVEYAKDAPDDVLIKVSVHNRGPKAKRIHVLPQLWYRNTWVWGCPHEGTEQKPTMQLVQPHLVACDHETLGRFFFEFDASTAKAPLPLFTDNETNKKRLFGQENASKYVKDAFHDYVVNGKKNAVNPERVGTKFAPYYVLEVKPGASTELRLRLYSAEDRKKDMLGKQFDQVFELRKQEADSFFYNDDVIHPSLTDDEKLVARQSYAGCCGASSSITMSSAIGWKVTGMK
jgi:hypothetical protein